MAAVERLRPGDAAALLVGAAVPDDHAAVAERALEVVVAQRRGPRPARPGAWRRGRATAPWAPPTSASPRRPRGARRSDGRWPACSWTTNTPALTPRIANCSWPSTRTGSTAGTRTPGTRTSARTAVPDRPRHAQARPVRPRPTRGTPQLASLGRPPAVGGRALAIPRAGLPDVEVARRAPGEQIQASRTVGEARPRTGRRRLHPRRGDPRSGSVGRQRRLAQPVWSSPTTAVARESAEPRTCDHGPVSPVVTVPGAVPRVTVDASVGCVPVPVVARAVAEGRVGVRGRASRRARGSPSRPESGVAGQASPRQVSAWAGLRVGDPALVERALDRIGDRVDLGEDVGGRVVRVDRVELLQLGGQPAQELLGGRGRDRDHDLLRDRGRDAGGAVEVERLGDVDRHDPVALSDHEDELEGDRQRRAAVAARERVGGVLVVDRLAAGQ